MPSGEASNWCVLIEENSKIYEEICWRNTHIVPGGTKEEAIRAAENVALTYIPQFPKLPRSRTVLRMSEVSLVVVVRGKFRDYQFRLTVAQWVGDFPM